MGCRRNTRRRFGSDNKAMATMLDSTEGSGAWGEYEGKGEPACALATTRLIPSTTLIRVAASPEREHAGFYLGTGTRKVSPCLLRNFHGTVPHPWFRLAQ